MSPETPPRPGAPFPLGAHLTATGARFAVTSSAAERVELCLLDDDGGQRWVELVERTFDVWHGLVEGVREGQRYGYRVHGPGLPPATPPALLLDPYARRVADGLGVVTAAGGPATGPAPQVPWEETVIYELHVGSFTSTHPDVPEQLRGTFAGVGHPAAVAHLVSLGVTAVELLPVHAIRTEDGVAARGMRNHWGYSTLGFFAPHPGYAATPGAEVAEFRAMVAALHEAGIEVLLDVVYNHTCEGGADGPVLSMRGLDPQAYYLHSPDGRLLDLTGCGNTLDPASPTVVRLVTDSLRYWAQEMGVDGFRFDLASALGRPRGAEFDPRAPLLTAIATDPVLSTRKLIAEPWDATGPGYQVGGFGVQWSEWNDRYRDTVRDFWCGKATRGELAYRLSGSSDLYARGGRRPWSSINFVTAHDGFTLHDLVSYERKHNEANGEDNRDGTDDNHSCNHGVEGATDDPAVLTSRAHHVRALAATLMLSTGTPMLLAGDELGNTQGGNNNAYCAPTSTAAPWTLDWVAADPDLLEFYRRLGRLRRSAPALRQPEFFEGRDTPSGQPDLVWFGAEGTEITDAQWQDHTQRTVQMWVDGGDVRSHDRHGDLLADHSWLLVLHSGAPAQVRLAPVGELEVVLDSGSPTGLPSGPRFLAGGTTVTVPEHTLWALRVLPPRA
ncbi:glycogen debranching protein GlgX [Rhodococcus sp. X156]|uniref:glycogen debranching protein GlgX n=1 Tax=Rhodococcus sp. X156 TaxID=2499145 RepID=UPI001F495AD5|nr:glycogen debranching protein GlgX [Rhodococcus sp. X156]